MFIVTEINNNLYIVIKGEFTAVLNFSITCTKLTRSVCLVMEGSALKILSPYKQQLLLYHHEIFVPLYRVM